MSCKLLLCALGSLLTLSSCDSDSESDENSATVTNTINIPNDLSSVTGTAATITIGNGADPSLEATYQTEIFNLINSSRAADGLSELLLDNRITALARQHNEDMINIGSGSPSIIISHDNFQGRADTLFALEYNSVGENVAGQRGFPEAEVANFFVDSWNNSSEHRANIIGTYSHTGISVLVDEADGTIYATQIFANE